MSIELYLAFVAATVVLIAFPGPNVTLIVANSLTYGSRRALMTVAGTQAAQFLQLAAVVIGMTSLLHLLAASFEVLRWIGVGYLLWLGVQRWRADGAGLNGDTTAAASSRQLFWQGFVVSATNPKVLFFYAAFFPQFIDPTAAAMPQLVALSATFITIAAVIDGGYALAGGRSRGWLVNRARARLTDRITGTMLIGTGLWLAFARRGS